MILIAATLLMRRRSAKFLTGWQEKTRLTRQHPGSGGRTIAILLAFPGSPERFHKAR